MGATTRSSCIHELNVKVGESDAKVLLTIGGCTFNFALVDASGVRVECS
jgi:hypothetical protein